MNANRLRQRLKAPWPLVIALAALATAGVVVVFVTGILPSEEVEDLVATAVAATLAAPTIAARVEATVVAAQTALASTPTSVPLPGLGGMDLSFTLYQGVDEVGGESMLLSQMKGKPVVLNFWWAGPLPARPLDLKDYPQLQVLQRFYEASQGQATVLSIDIGEILGTGSRQDAQALLRELGTTYPAGFTVDNSVVQRFEILGIPTIVFLDSDMEIFEKWTGSINQEIIEERVADIVAGENR